MQEELISYNTAELAKKKGFNIPTWDYFCPQGEQCNPNRQDWNSLNTPYEHTSRPSQSLLAKWLREVHNIDASALKIVNYKMEEGYLASHYFEEWSHKASLVLHNFQKETYEEALEGDLLHYLSKI